MAVTTVAPTMGSDLPGGVRLVGVRGEPQETRRISAARLLGAPTPAAAVVWEALVAGAAETPETSEAPPPSG